MHSRNRKEASIIVVYSEEGAGYEVKRSNGGRWTVQGFLKGHQKSLGFYSGKKEKPLKGFWERNERPDIFNRWLAV